MFETCFESRRIATAILLGLSLFVTACGGSSDGGAPPDQATGTVALLLTDMPTDDLDEINLKVVEATLIGGEGQQTLFSDAENPIQIDLLDLQNFSQPIAFEDVPADVYTKLRLRISELRLVEYVEGGEDKEYTPPLPANGKIDLLHPDGFEVLPGRTLIVELDMDANKSIHVVQTGNSKYRMRPVVFVEFSNDEAPDKLTRFEGSIEEIIDGAAGSFVLCSSTDADTCIDVNLTTDGCVFDVEGIPTEPTALEAGQDVVVIGFYSRMDGHIMLDAIVVEQGPANQIKGVVSSEPAEGTFAIIDRNGVELTVELQDGCTHVLGPDGAIVGAEGITIGQGIEVEGVFGGEPEVLRAALILLDADDELQQLSGKLKDPIEDTGFILATTGGDICVQLVDGAVITLINTETTEVGPVDITDLVAEQAAEVYGTLSTDGVEGCFQASEVVVTIP